MRVRTYDMGARVSLSDRGDIEQDFSITQADVHLRVDYAYSVNQAITNRALFEVSAPLGGGGLTSFVRHACVVPQYGKYRRLSKASPKSVARTVLMCQYVAVLKCEKAPVTYDPHQFAYDAAIASLLTSLVEGNVSPHFTMLYYANVDPVHTMPDVRAVIVGPRLGSHGSGTGTGTGAGAGGDDGGAAGAGTALQHAQCMLLEANELTVAQFLRTTPSVDMQTVLSMIFQVAHALLAAFVAFGISHNDLHQANVMGVRVPADTAYTYEFFGHTCTVPLRGWLWKLIDFNNADVGMAHEHLDLFTSTGASGQIAWGPVADFFKFLPAVHGLRAVYNDLYKKFITDKGSGLTPGFQIEVMVFLLVRTYASMPEYTGPPPTKGRTFSLNNEASMARQTDGVRKSLAFSGAKTYVIRNRKNRPMPLRRPRTFTSYFRSSAPTAQLKRMNVWRDEQQQQLPDTLRLAAAAASTAKESRPMKKVRVQDADADADADAAVDVDTDADAVQITDAAAANTAAAKTSLLTLGADPVEINELLKQQELPLPFVPTTQGDFALGPGPPGPPSPPPPMRLRRVLGAAKA